MSKETCGGNVPVSWEFWDGIPGKSNLTHTFFLRDDQDAGITAHYCWSLFCQTPDFYGRLIVYSHMLLDDAVEKARKEMDEFFKRQFDLCKI